MSGRAKKSLGQHFLRSKTAINKMIDAASIMPGELVLEVGPGKGVLTDALLNAGAHVIAVETDRTLIPELSIRFEDAVEDGRLDLIHGDILNKKLEREIFHTDLAGNRPYKVVANIPYYITGALFRLFLEEYRQPTSLTFLVQKEVAEQLVAKDKKEGILSLSVKVYGDPRYVATVKRESFSPAPKVDSAIICVDHISRDRILGIEKSFFSLIKAGLSSKRKMLLGNLTKKTHVERTDLERVFASLNIPLAARGEDLDITKWVELTRALSKKAR